MATIKISACEFCGSFFEKKNKKHKFCCKECEKRYYNSFSRGSHIKKRPKQQSELARINAEARAHGMTYGKYVALKWDREQRNEGRRKN